VPPRPHSTSRERRLAEAGVLLVMIAWAANFIVVKSATGQIPPVTFSLLRFAFAATTLLIALRWREGNLGLPRRDIIPVLGLGAIGFGLYQILWTVALRDIPAGDSALLIATTPVITALLAVRSGADTLTRTKLLGSLTSFAGVAIIVASGPGFSLGSALVGDVLTLAAAGCWSVYTAFGAPILRRHSPLRTTAWAMVGGALTLAIPGVAQGVGVDWAAIRPEAWAGLAFSATVAAGVANVLVFAAIRLLGPTRITAYQFLVPFIAVLLGSAFLAEAIRIEQILGGIVIVLGVAITRTDRITAFGGWLRTREPG
jgi:drug/metabolite transporter (DMT)-like permease